MMGLCLREYNEAPISVAMWRKPEMACPQTSPVATEMGVSPFNHQEAGDALCNKGVSSVNSSTRVWFYGMYTVEDEAVGVRGNPSTGSKTRGDDADDRPRATSSLS